LILSVKLFLGCCNSGFASLKWRRQGMPVTLFFYGNDYRKEF